MIEAVTRSPSPRGAESASLKHSAPSNSSEGGDLTTPQESDRADHGKRWILHIEFSASVAASLNSSAGSPKGSGISDDGGRPFGLRRISFSAQQSRDPRYSVGGCQPTNGDAMVDAPTTPQSLSPSRSPTPTPTTGGTLPIFSCSPSQNSTTILSSVPRLL